MRLEVDLKVVKEPVAFNGKGVMIENGAKEAVKFLNHFDHAKLVIAIDSHCGDNGFLVWKTEDNGEYQTCSLKEVSTVAKFSHSASDGSADSGTMHSGGHLQLNHFPHIQAAQS